MEEKNGEVKEEQDLLERTQQQVNDLSERMFEVIALYKLSKGLKISFQMETIFNDMEGLLKEAFDIKDFSIMALDEKGESLSLWTANARTFREVQGVTFALGEGISGTVAKTGKPILVRDVNQDDRFLHFKGKKRDIGSFYSIPLLTLKKKVIGVLNIHKSQPQGFTEQDLGLFNIVGQHISQAMENSMTFQEVRKLAITDELTGLYSRRYFLEAIEKEISISSRRGGVFSLIMVDVDHFKRVNDRFGHQSGDKVLYQLASILRSATRKEDVCARYGGEEFILLLPGTTVEEAMDVAEKLRGKAEEELWKEIKELSSHSITLSAGVTSYPAQGQTTNSLIASVDNRLYAAKLGGRNLVCGPEELNQESQNPQHESRKEHRFQLGLSLVTGKTHLQFVEILNQGKWRICVLENISKSGLKGTVEFPAELGEKLKCRILSVSGEVDGQPFFANVMYKNTVATDRFSLGLEVLEPKEVWQAVLQKISR